MSAAPRAVAVVGAEGRMGRFASALLERSPDYALVARLDRGDALAEGLAASGAELALDVTVAGRGFEHGRTMLEAGVRPVIATSGVSLEQNAELDRIARERDLGGLVVPNLSLGAWVLEQAAQLVARHFEHFEIVETHHAEKRDAPSGTARHLAERLCAQAGTDDATGVPIHSLRLPGAYAQHAVHFGAPGERLVCEHETSSPEAFAPGIALALRVAAEARGVGRGLPWPC